MKKVASLVLALMLCLAMTAFAAVPSVNTGALISAAVTSPAGTDVAVKAVGPDDATEEQKAAVEAELTKLADTTIADYFAGATDAEGNPADLAAIVGTDNLDVNEFTTLTIENYDASMGDVTVALLCGTQFTEGDTVVVLIGIVTVAEDGAQTVDWTALEGTVIDNLGRVEVTIPAELAESVSQGTALMAIVSAAPAEA